MDAALVLFAIDAGMRLGRKVNEVLVDETARRPLLLPLGDLFGSITEAEAMRFFATEGSRLVSANGPLHTHRANRPKLVEFYRAIRGVEDAHGPTATPAARRTELAARLNSLDQFDNQFTANHPVRRLFGTVVEIGIDHLVRHPEAMGKDSPARKIIHACISALDEARFTEGSGRELLGDLLAAALRTLGQGAELVGDDRRLQVLLGGILTGVATDLDAARHSGNDLSRQQLFRRIGCGILRGGSAAFAEHPELFLPGEGNAPQLVGQTLTQMLAGLNGREDLFTPGAIEIIFKSALRVAGENAALVTDDQVLQPLISRVLDVVTGQPWNKLFSPTTAASVLFEALEIFRENIGTLTDPERPEKQVLPKALAAMAGSLSTKLAGGGRTQELLSHSQLIELTRDVFRQVANHPALLVGDTDADPKHTVLAQVIGSVARALGDEPLRLTNGAGLVELVHTALAVTVNNASQLVDTKSANPGTTLLFNLLKQIVSAVTTDNDPRQLISREGFLEIVRRVLPVASANVEALAGARARAVQTTVAAALQLSSGRLQGRINGANLPRLIQQLLHLVLWDELDPDDKAALERAARLILKTI